MIYDNCFPDVIAADPRLVRQIAVNLITNGIKYSPHKTPVHITLNRDEGACILTVQDHGIGISEADQSRLFAAFEPGASLDEVAGSGLGLAIVQRAVEMSGGSVTLESQLDMGTTVTVSLPILDDVQDDSLNPFA